MAMDMKLLGFVIAISIGLFFLIVATAAMTGIRIEAPGGPIVNVMYAILQLFKTP